MARTHREVIERTIIKADPKWYVVYYLPDEHDKYDLYPTPIIAWEIRYVRASFTTPGEDPVYYYDPQPLLAEGEPDSNPWCIKTPDNDFIFPEDTTEYSEKAALDHFKELGHFQVKEKPNE